jgi:hypothetical protein
MCSVAKMIILLCGTTEIHNPYGCGVIQSISHIAIRSEISSLLNQLLINTEISLVDVNACL